MKAPLSWIREYVDLPEDVDAEALAAELTALGLKLEALHGGELTGPLVVARVLDYTEEPQKNGKVIRWCQVQVGANPSAVSGIVCGADNFAVGDLVVAALPGACLPGGFQISARKTYGHVSNGMLCSSSELGLTSDASGILILDQGQPGDDALALLGLDDVVIEFEINPDRAYALSLRGVAREAALAYDAPYRDPARIDVPASSDSGYPVRLEDAGCAVFVACTVRGFDPAAATPSFIAKRVEACGMRSISLAVDITNYVMLELGQPLHAYDADALQGPIVVRRARAGENLETLDGVQRTLHPQDLLITDDSGPIGLAGVMGGASTEVSAGTTSMVIEAAHFDPASVFRTQRRHKLPSEASKRFERGVDPQLPPFAVYRAAQLMVEHGGGTIEPGLTSLGQAPDLTRITAPVDLPARITGMPITAQTTLGHLRAVGCEVSLDGEQVTVLAPSWRPDLSDPYDLVEEVARIVGYDKVPSILPAAPAGRGLTPAQKLRRRASLALAGAGLVEVKTYPFVGPADYDALGLGEQDPRRTSVRLANPLSEAEPWLTTTLLPGLLKAAARNVGRGQPDLGIFEIAAVFRPLADGAPAPILGVAQRPSEAELQSLFAAIPEQPRHAAVVLSGQREASGPWGTGRPANWSDAIATARELARLLHVDLGVRTGQRAPWHPGRCAELTVTVEAVEQVIGHAGELHPHVCRDYGVPARTCAVELDLDALIAAARPRVQAPQFSTMPFATQDVAVVVGREVPAAQVQAALTEGAGSLLESIRLFDVYEGPQVGEGKKSLAFALRFRAPDRTLTEKETGAARDSAVALAAQRFDAVQRA